MKKTMSFAAFLLLTTVAALGQDPVITFTKTEHDFGKINEADGRVTTVFEFKNEGMTPLVLSNVRASCGCTTPKWTREPIEPGEIGQITVTYNPNGRPGPFQKTITITSNATEATKRLYIKGEVIPKPAKPVDQYPIKMGGLSLKTQRLDFGKLKKGDNKMLEIEYANQTQENMTVDLLMRNQDSYFKNAITLKEVHPNETGKIQIALESAECPLYGPIKTEMYVVVNGKKSLTDEYAILLAANIQEDFSMLSVEERQLAPIVEVPRDIEIGTIKAGKKVQHKVVLGNAGTNPLIVHRVISDDSLLRVSASKVVIKGGHKGELKLDIIAPVQGTNDQASVRYSRIVTLITNDPNSPVITLRIHWTVE